MVIDQTVINIGTNSGSPTTLYENTGSTDVIINNLLTVSKYNDFPTSETEKLTASDAYPFDQFGYSVAISGDGGTIIVGARYDDGGGLTEAGSAYIYKYNSGTSSWDETKITASDAGISDKFGNSVAMSADGNSVIVGAVDNEPIGSPSNSNQGSAYIYKYNSGTWDETQITASDAADLDKFGWSVAMSGDGNSVIVGAYYDGTGLGSAYIYKYNSGTDSWDETKLTASDGDANDNFGISVSMSSDGNSVIVGSFNDDISSNSNQGSAYIYKYNSGTDSWDETKLTASDGAADDYFGNSVSMSSDGNSVIVGARGDDISSNSDQGSAYIYKYNSGTSSWDETKLTASDGAADDRFGNSVSMSIDGNSVVVGAILDSISSILYQGSAYIYKYNSGTSSWDETKLTASDGASYDNFGQSIAMSGDGNSVIVGAHQDDDGDTNTGSAYIFQSSDNDITIIKEDANANDYTLINQSYSNKSNQIITKDNKIILKPNEKIKGYGSSPDSNVVITTIVQE